MTDEKEREDGSALPEPPRGLGKRRVFAHAARVLWSGALLLAEVLGQPHQQEALTVVRALAVLDEAVALGLTVWRP